MLDRTKVLAKTLSDPNRKPNDFALAKYLNERVVAIFQLAIDQRNSADIAAINKSYILMVNELKNSMLATTAKNKILRLLLANLTLNQKRLQLHLLKPFPRVSI